MYKFSLTRWSGVNHHLLGRDMWYIASSFIVNIQSILNNAVYVGIEDQPFKANTKVVRLKSQIESILRMKYPQISVYLVPPRSVRCFWKTSGRTYLERKLNSLNTDVLSEHDLQDALVIFDKNEDPIEAMQLCIYTALHLTKLKRMHLDDKTIRIFEHSEFTCTQPSTYVTPQLKKSKYFSVGESTPTTLQAI